MYDVAFFTKILYDSPIKLFYLKTLRDILRIKKISSFYNVVHRLVKSGVLEKIERGKYVLKNDSENEFALAHFIYEPSYISFESALSFYGILPQFPYEVTSATIKQTKTKEHHGKSFSYYHLQKGLFWGYIKQDKYLIAEKEKALLDQLYFSAKGIKTVHLDEYDFSLVNKTTFKMYLARFPMTRQFKKIVLSIPFDAKK